MLAGGQWREAYDSYALAANRHGTYQATFQALIAKYPQIEPKAILADVVAATLGDNGKWFAAAKSAGLLAEASELARTSPCDPKTLTRAARDFAASKPEFARSVGLAALKWILRGHGYDLTSQHVTDALGRTLEAARPRHRGRHSAHDKTAYRSAPGSRPHRRRNATSTPRRFDQDVSGFLPSRVIP